MRLPGGRPSSAGPTTGYRLPTLPGWTGHHKGIGNLADACAGTRTAASPIRFPLSPSFPSLASVTSIPMRRILSCIYVPTLDFRFQTSPATVTPVH